MGEEVETLKRELEALKVQLEAERKKNTNIQVSTSPQHAESTSQNDKSKQKSLEASRVSSTEPRLYIQHAAVGSRRGKWWLRERQVLGQSTWPPDDDCATLKVRETWAWSGRTVILDKIVRIDDKEEAETSGQLQKLKEVETQDGEAGVECSVKDSTVGWPQSTPRESAQPSKDAKTSETANTTGADVVDIATEKEMELQALATKAEDELRESSTPSEH